jgi:molecular chaperone GrpE
VSDETPIDARPTNPEVRVVDKRKLTREPVAEAEAESPSTEDEHARALNEARAQAASHLEDLKRLKAEFENYRKRMVKEQTAMIERASAAVVERLLPILDNFELALMAADRTMNALVRKRDESPSDTRAANESIHKDYESMVRGVEMVYGELLEVLKREGLERIESLHRPFDPELHEAVMHAEGEGDEIVVLDEMRPGYKLGGRVIRPAMVKVGQKQE